MKWIKQIKRWFERNRLRMQLVPFSEAPLDEWRSFAENAPRWLVEETAEKWWDNFDETRYWRNVNEILKERCSSFEHPFVRQSFVERNLERILYVKKRLRADEIVTICKTSGKKYPFFVVENTGRLLGIALNQKLVIAGVINNDFYESKARDIQERNGTRFLNLQNVEWFPCFSKEVSKMLVEAGLEPLGEAYWYRDVGVLKVWSPKTQRKGLDRILASVIGKF